MAERILIATANAGKIDPGSLTDYLEAGGFSALGKAREMEPAEVFRQVIASGLQGRGGAGFPTGSKEKDAGEAICDACGPKYVVCNADEGEPGTFKDRVIMEMDPHLLLEGMLISAHAIGAERGYIYIRGEYRLSIERVGQAVENLRKAGWLGGGGFDIEIRIGAGSYLCGEELTLLESLEGRRGYPRIKPPFPSRVGLFGAPTLINNVETFAHIPWIIRKGAEEYRRLGYEGSPGTKIFTVSGDVEKPGWYEEELGISLRELIFDRCGGMRKDKPFFAALLGGAAGTFVDASFLDTPLAYNSLRAAGASLGSGAVIVLSGGRKLMPVLESILEFFRHESCGKCIPCRVGTAQLTELAREASALPRGERSELLKRMVEEARFMDKTSLCPLGKSPILPLASLERLLSKEL
jgi:NADH:ubiquinone oxidoreductase subunit F (NADH-binding)